VNATVTEARRGRDGRFCPPELAVPPGERQRAISLSHILRCRDHLSYRQVRTVLAQYGIHRSLGQVFKDLRNYECARCAGQPGPLPAAKPEPEPEPVHKPYAVPWGGRP